MYTKLTVDDLKATIKLARAYARELKKNKLALPLGEALIREANLAQAYAPSLNLSGILATDQKLCGMAYAAAILLQK